MENLALIDTGRLQVGVLMQLNRDASLVCGVLRGAGIQASTCPAESLTHALNESRFDCLLCAEDCSMK